MHNWYSIESESAHRRMEWERAVAAEARVAQIVNRAAGPRWPRLPHLSLGAFRQKLGARLAFGLPATAHGDCAPSTN